ncbi:putative integrase/recombinase domain protein [Burkholderia pseudomallei]|nr:putative integrase/recombinase domain protein [Burkholderia pseudomallei]
MPAEGETGELPANPADYAARRLATFEHLRTIAFDRFARANARVPRAQRGQGRSIRKG